MGQRECSSRKGAGWGWEQNIPLVLSTPFCYRPSTWAARAARIPFRGLSFPWKEAGKVSWDVTWITVFLPITHPFPSVLWTSCGVGTGRALNVPVDLYFQTWGVPRGTFSVARSSRSTKHQ
jgi:hypothetical protein